MADKNSKQQKDLALLRVQYAAYRRKATANPDNADKVLGFKAWVNDSKNKSQE